MIDYQKIIDVITKQVRPSKERDIATSHIPGLIKMNSGKLGIHPIVTNKDNFCVITWSPELNLKGYSKLGMEVLEKLTTKTGQSIF